VRVDANDLGTGLLDQLLQFIDFEHRNTELRMQAGCLDVLVVATPVTRVHAYKHFLSLEQLGPCLERIKVVESQLQTFAERPRVLVSRCKVRREQNAPNIDAR
jgi:hypothetical protein